MITKSTNYNRTESPENSAGFSHNPQQCGQTAPPMPLIIRAANMENGVRAVNEKIQRLRYALFGDAQPKECDIMERPVGPVSDSISGALDGLNSVQEQLDGILSRLT